ncbi:hypothetical protein DMENIID0001_039520 [Sergentomyia squamirostris]
MSVCVTSSSANGGAMALPHLPLVSSMMTQPHHPMAPTNLTSSTLVDQQTTLSSPDHPNPDMLLALIARNKALEAVLEEIFLRADKALARKASRWIKYANRHGEIYIRAIFDIASKAPAPPSPPTGPRMMTKSGLRFGTQYVTPFVTNRVSATRISSSCFYHPALLSVPPTPSGESYLTQCCVLKRNTNYVFSGHDCYRNDCFG